MGYKDLQKPLEIKDIDFRVQSINNGGYATILAYKDARVDMRRLDEALGIENWQRDVKLVNGVLYGGVGIYNKELKDWVWKWDAGTESNTEKEKGQASDAFKRACFNLGIGRELYNYPIISVKLNVNEINEKNGKKYASWDFKLKEWKWLSQFKDGELSFLAAKDTNGIVRFKWGAYDKALDEVESTASGAPTPAPIEDVSPTNVKAPIEDANVGQFLKKDSVEEETKAPVKEEAKVPTSAEIKRDELAQKYKLMFGKSPSKAMKLETLEGKIAQETEKRAAAKLEAEKEEELLSEKLKGDNEVGGAVYSASGEKAEDPYGDEKGEMTEEQLDEEEAEVVESEGIDLGIYNGPMIDDVNKISDFKDKTEFKTWAVSIFKKWKGKAPDTHIEEFQAMCNAHFEKIG